MEGYQDYTPKNKPVSNLVWQKDIYGKYLWCNEEFGIFVGKDPALVAGLTDYDLFTAEHAEKYISDDRKVIDSGNSNEFEESTEKDGKVIWWRTRKFPVRDKNGIIDGVFGEAEDITWIKIVQKKLDDNEIKFNNLINNFPGFAYHCLNDRNWTMLYLSHRFSEITGYNIQDVINNKTLSYNDIIFPDDREWLFEKWEKVIKENRDFEGEYRIITQSGEIRWVWERGRSIKAYGDKMTFINGIVIDITERKLALESNKENEARYKRLTENADDIIFRFDLFPEPKLTYINPAVEKITGLSTEECYTIQDISTSNLHPDDLPFMLQMINSRKIQKNSFTLRWQNKNGKWHWLESKVVPVYNEKGKMIAVEGVTRDITEKKNIDDQIASERILLRTIIDTVPDTLYVKDMQGNKILANKAEMKILNVNSVEEYYGKPDTEFYTREAGEKYWADDLEVLNSGKPKLNIQELVIDRSGKKWWLLTSKVPLYDKDGNLQGLVGLGRDITERKELQDQLENYKTHLEELVKQRTCKLEEKNKELQRLNDIFVGREFRIKELKDTIKELGERLGKQK
jgi:PAS domain S-box-containing protein